MSPSLGTGVSFDIVYATANGTGGPGSGGGTTGSGSGWKSQVTVNGSAPDPDSSFTATGVTDLNPGTYVVQLVLSRTDGLMDNSTWARIDGVRGVLDGAIGPDTTNATIDDSAWLGGANGTVVLTPGWNMVSSGIDRTTPSMDNTTADTMRQSVGHNFNNSISWCTETGVNNTIQFTGSALWVYGWSGGPSGQFQVMLDGVSKASYNVSGGPVVYRQLLYHTSGLTDGQHTLNLVNQEGQLSFDYMVAMTKMGPASLAGQLTSSMHRPTMSAGAPSWTLGPTSAAAESGGAAYDSRVKTAVGAAVGASVGLAIIGMLLFFCYRRREKKRQRRPTHKLGWDEDRPWHRRVLKRDVGWRFINLPEEYPAGSMREIVPGTPLRARTHASGSSFGSTHGGFGSGAAPGLAQVPAAYTRRSLLPFRNNLWAKERTGSIGGDDAVPMQDVSRSPSTSPDPMRAALGGDTSPLSNLQRGISNGGGHGAYGGEGKDGRSAADKWREKERAAAHRIKSQELLPPAIPGGGDPGAGPAGPSGTNSREWHDWVGLSTYGERGSRHLSNLFGLGGGGGKSPGKPKSGKNQQLHRHVLDDDGEHVMGNVADLPEPPRRYGDKRDTAASQWARF